MDTDFDTLNPTDDDLFAEAEVEDNDTDSDEWEWDDDYSPRDDRYDNVGRNGMPSWSLFAN